MAETETIDPAHEDFVAAALRATKTPMDKGDQLPPLKTEKEPPKQKEPPPKKVEPPAPEKPLPDQLFSKKTEAKAAAAVPKSELDEIETPEFKDPKRKAQWDTLHGKASALEKRAVEAEKKVQEAEKRLSESTGNAKELETLRATLSEKEAKYNEAMGLVKQVNIDLDPAYRSKYVEGRKTIVKSIQKDVSESGGDGDAIAAALALTGSERNKAIAAAIGDLPNFTQGIIGRKIEQLETLDTEGAAQRSNPDDFFASRQREEQERTARQREELQRTANIAFDHALKESSSLEVLTEVPGLEWWNQQRADILKKSREIYDTNQDPRVIARLIIEGQSTPVYRQLFLDQRGETDKWKALAEERGKELSGLYKRTPSVGGGSVRDGGSAKDMTFAEISAGLANGTITKESLGK